MSHAIIRGKSGRRHEVDFEDSPVRVEIYASDETVEIVMEADSDELPLDVVLCTHLHLDHVGWNTRWDGARWVPTFPNASYLFGRFEWEHWT